VAYADCLALAPGETRGRTLNGQMNVPATSTIAGSEPGPAYHTNWYTGLPLCHGQITPPSCPALRLQDLKVKRTMTSLLELPR
jgi:hypothetical protein